MNEWEEISFEEVAGLNSRIFLTARRIAVIHTRNVLKMKRDLKIVHKSCL